MTRRLLELLLGLAPSSFQQQQATEFLATYDQRRAQDRGPLSRRVLEIRELIGAVVLVWRLNTGSWCNHIIGWGAAADGIATGARDVRIAARGLARRPGFSLSVALTLGLGIGAATTIYSVVDGVLLRPLPYNDPAMLVALGGMRRGGADAAASGEAPEPGRISGPNFIDVRERARSFSALAVVEPNQWPLTGEGEAPEMLAAARVSPGFFEVLGISPALGGTLQPNESRVDTPGTVILSYGAWQRRYGGNPSIVGQTLERSIVPMTIVGVLPSDFRPPEAIFPEGEEPEIWVPLPANRYERRERATLLALGRLAPGVSVAAAQSELREISRHLVDEFPEANRGPDGSDLLVGVNSLHAQTVGSTSRALGIFLGASALLLLLAVMNSATLFLARGLDRSRELGVRAALGAGRLRVVRLLLTEASILSLLGGAVGLLCAFGGVAAFVRYAPSSIPRLSSVAVDLRILGFTGVSTAAVGIAAGLLPALRLTRRGQWHRLKQAGRSETEPHSRLRLALVGGQIAAAVVLLCGAALLFTSFVRLRTADPGFDPEDRIGMLVDLEGFARSSPDQFTTVWAAWDVALAELGSVPGVEAIEATTNIPFQSPSWAPSVLLPDDEPDTWRDGIAGYVVTPGYLDLMGIELRRGRGLERLDGPDSERVALVNESFVRTQLDGTDPLSATLLDTEGPTPSPIRIVGVVEDVVQARAEDGPRPAIYVPYTQRPGAPRVVIRTERSLESILPELRTTAASFNPIVPLQEVGSLEDRMITARTSPRFQTLLIGAFAMVALVLAVVGLYGSLAHSVGRRRRELGVRMALGADRAGVLRMVLGQGMRVSLAGLAIGMLISLAFTRVLAGFLYSVEPNDPATLASVAIAFLIVSGVASLEPARRATGVHPASVLKSE